MTNNKITPYDTGKVKIGLHYDCRPMQPLDGNADADRLQAALLFRAHTNCVTRLATIVRRVLGV